MRTTINLNDDLVRRAKSEAVRRGGTLTSFIEDALRAALAQKPNKESQRFRIEPLRGGGEFRPGVDLDDNAALLDLMEQED
ncbi:MAG: CopG family transcriptional regulator [Acidimicrobiia bacterium]